MEKLRRLHEDVSAELNQEKRVSNLSSFMMVEVALSNDSPLSKIL